MNQPDTPQVPSSLPPPVMSPEQLHADLSAIRSVLNESATARSPHRNIIAAGNLICGFLMLIAVPILFIVFSIPLVASPQEKETFPIAFIGLGIIIVLLVLASPFLVAGWGLLKNKSWGIIAALVAAALNLMNFPLGTILSIYTFWAVSSGNLVRDPKAGKL